MASRGHDPQYGRRLDTISHRSNAAQVVGCADSGSARRLSNSGSATGPKSVRFSSCRSREGERVRIAQRAVIAVVISGVLGAGGLAAGAVAQAAPSGRAYVGCGTNYNHCVVLRRAYIKDGNRVGPIHIGYPGCTAPPESGCANEDWFYVYR